MSCSPALNVKTGLFSQSLLRENRATLRTPLVSLAFITSSHADHRAFVKIELRFARKTLADGGGFEPPIPFGIHAFQACAIDHSATHPLAGGC